MVSHAERRELRFADAAAWESWLDANAATSDGVRLVLRRVTTVAEGLLYPEALDVALCFGWIDGTARRLDDDFFFRDFGPRRARSIWSQVNIEHTDRLIAAGRMRTRGIEEIERAKSDGRWDAAYRQKGAEVPDDLAAALAASPAASAMFDRLTGQNRFAVLFRIGTVKRAGTRAAKIAGIVAALERGDTIHPQSGSARK
ncbi:MAG: YdeI/OmpD-associated family protein [Actinomycetota bacterium]